MINRLLAACRLTLRRRRYRAGATISHFIAKDIRRDVEVVDASEIGDGFIRARIRTWNVLYTSKGIDQKPEFGTAERVNIDRLWDWEGPTWGGPVPPANLQEKAGQ